MPDTRGILSGNSGQRATEIGTQALEERLGFCQLVANERDAHTQDARVERGAKCAEDAIPAFGQGTPDIPQAVREVAEPGYGVDEVGDRDRRGAGRLADVEDLDIDGTLRRIERRTLVPLVDGQIDVRLPDQLRGQLVEAKLREQRVAAVTADSVIVSDAYGPGRQVLGRTVAVSDDRCPVVDAQFAPAAVYRVRGGDDKSERTITR